MGAHLHLAEGTVKTHVTGLLRTLGVRNRIEAAYLPTGRVGCRGRRLPSGRTADRRGSSRGTRARGFPAGCRRSEDRVAGIVP
ncbi:LuxR C-terminal-related transcriptional regulator [Modestobacter sp. SSW1-42]|uniref:LuxR C-terminal-related transcriptional regulator n=1 Tax=Modestobacter sp. SSW1-42 TaxID=596372 RepID=UPI0039869DBF